MNMLSIRLWYTVAALSVMGAAIAMEMEDMLMGQTLDSFLSGLVLHEQLSEEHKLEIVNMASPPTDATSDGDIDGDSSNAKEHYRDQGFTTAESKELLRDYLYNTVNDGSMEEETAEAIASTLNLGGLYFTEEMVESLALMQGLNGAASADYQGEGNMHRLGRISPVPLSQWSITNGIWGYATPNGAREYALMCAGPGLSIVDVTDAAKPVRVQFTPMSGGGIWRDVCTHVDEASGTTYAYVAAQGGSNPSLFVYNLSYLSDDPNKPNVKDSNPIPLGEGYSNRGQAGFGHTVNCARGLLFLHTAGTTHGCRVYDIKENPTQPKFLFHTGGTGGCHDSMVQTNVDVEGEAKDLWIISEAYSRTDNIRDITNVNSETKTVPPLLGRTPSISGIYAHSSALYNDRYLFQTDENNRHDICVYDIGNLMQGTGSPQLISRFQYSEHNSMNALTHNGFIRGNYYFNAYYQAGLRVFDISNPYYVHEVGKVETYRDPDGNGQLINVKKTEYKGSWNVYPYLPSGNILVNDMYHGLFIVAASAPYDPPEPPILSAERDGGGNANLSWNVGINVRGYSVIRSFDGSTYAKIAEHIMGNSFLDNDAQGKSAFYKVIAVNGEGEGTSVPVYSEVTPEPTRAPTQVPTPLPTHVPTPLPTPLPTHVPTDLPTHVPTPLPTHVPTTHGATPEPTHVLTPAPTHLPTPEPTSGGVTSARAGPQTASYNPTFGAPSCSIGSSCDSKSLLDGRHNLGPEPNQPNTLDGCLDGKSGAYHRDESVDAIFISSDSSDDMMEGSTITVNAGVFCWGNGSKDFIYFFHAADASNPNWTLMKRVQCASGGNQSLSDIQTKYASYDLPKGALQAVRVSIRYENGDPNLGPCFSGNYNDTDDVVIQVKEDPSFLGTAVAVEAKKVEDDKKKNKRANAKKQLRKNSSR